METGSGKASEQEEPLKCPWPSRGGRRKPRLLSKSPRRNRLVLLGHSPKQTGPATRQNRLLWPKARLPVLVVLGEPSPSPGKGGQRGHLECGQ